MTRPELLLHLNRLETAMQKRYTEGFKLVAFDYLGGRTADDLRFSVNRIIETEKTLPALSVILANLPQEEKLLQVGPGADYWAYLEAAHKAAELVVGEPFEKFVKLCNGNKPIAALYFGMAYWNARGVKKYDGYYDALINKLEKTDNPSAADLAGGMAEARP